MDVYGTYMHSWQTPHSKMFQGLVINQKITNFENDLCYGKMFLGPISDGLELHG